MAYVTQAYFMGVAKKTHTPGPWFVGHLETAIVTGSPAGYILYRGVPPFTDGDAHLIGAAPDLLAASMALLARLKIDDDNAVTGIFGAETYHAIEMTRAAIAKATGE